MYIISIFFFISSSLIKYQIIGATLDFSVNSYYDAGYEQGKEEGYNDGIENIRGDSYDDACRYKGKKRKEYELGYEEGYDAGFDDGFADSGCDSEEEE